MKPLLVLLMLCGLAGTTAAQNAPMVARPGDRLAVTVTGQPEVTGTYTVEGDGTVALPLIGRVRVAGATEAALQEDLARRLEVYLKAPVVHVGITRPRRVFIFGGVKAPGTYELSNGPMILIELLVTARYNGVSEVLVVRRRGAIGPVLPDQAEPGDVTRVNLRDVERALASGDLTRNFELEPGDTIFVPEVDPNLVHVDGEVHNAGSFSVPDGTTVRQVIALAGGPTSRAAMTRVSLSKIENGEQRRRKIDLDAVLTGGETISVPAAYSLPGIPVPPGILRQSGEDRPDSIQIGSALSLTPSLVFTQFGIDTNVLNDPENPKTAFVAELSPQLGVELDVGRLRMTETSSLGLAYFHRLRSERAVSPRHDITAAFDVARGVVLTGGYGTGYMKGRMSAEFDLRLRRHENSTSVGIELGPWGRVKFNAGWNDLKRRFPGQEIRSLTENARTTSGRFQWAVTPLTTIFLSGDLTLQRFPLLGVRDARTASVRLGTEFRRRALVEGSAYLAMTRYDAVDDDLQNTDTLGAGVMLWHTWRQHTQVGVRVERGIGTTFREEFPYTVVSGYGGWAQRRLSRIFDVVAETYTNRFSYPSLNGLGPDAADAVAENTVRYAAQLGVTLRGTRIGLEAAHLQRLGRGAPLRSRDYSGWRMNVLIDASFRFVQMRRNEGSSIRGRDGFRTY